MNRIQQIIIAGLFVMALSGGAQSTQIYTDALSNDVCSSTGCSQGGETFTPGTSGNTLYIYVDYELDDDGCKKCYGGDGAQIRIYNGPAYTMLEACSFDNLETGNIYATRPWDSARLFVYTAGKCHPYFTSAVFIFSTDDLFTISGNTTCADETRLYIKNGTEYILIDSTTLSEYSFNVLDNADYRVCFDDVYYDFTCDGDEVFDYDACMYVYGYTCGVDTIKLRDNNSQLIETLNQGSGYDVYEMQIVDGEEYTISFYDQGIILCYEQTFTCTGDHVLIDFDRCEWIYPPNGHDIPIYIWSGYDYNVVVFKDNHGNMVENAELAVYDNTDDTYIQKWTGNGEGYALLGAKFNTDHDVLMMLRTFDGVFTLETTYPANGSALVGEEDITTTEWTIPIKYNLNFLPVDQYAAQLFDVFCGLSEYTPLNPQAFWGMDLSDCGYVPVTNCSGFAMCDIIAEKEGYADYKVEALNWTSKSALVKDYRHNVVMEEI